MRSIYTITKYVCLSDSIDFSFLGFIIGMIGFFTTITVGIILYFRTMKKTKELFEPFKSKFIQIPGNSDVIVSIDQQ